MAHHRRHDVGQRVVVRALTLTATLTEALRDAVSFGTVWIAVTDGDVVGAAVWLPPGTYPWSTLRSLRAVPAFARVLVAAPGSLPGLMRLGSKVDEAFPDDPVWYLEVLGVRPETQHGGLGRRLLTPGLARADADHAPCYLETPQPANLPFYERAGFHVERKGVRLLEAGPTYWTMRRPAPVAS